MALNFPPGTPGLVYNGPNGIDYTYNGTLGVWTATAASASTLTFGLGLDITGTLVKAAVEEATAPPAVGALPTEAVIGSTYYDTNLGAMFIYYSNGASPTWVMV